MSSLAGSPAPEAAQRLHGPVSMGRDFAHELERAKHAVKRRLKRIRRDAAAGKKILEILLALHG